ncbi:MAG: UPF0149 family protein [Thermodesulfobacteriota bacterium]
MFTANEKKNLSRLLSKAVNSDDALGLDELHGFLFGLAIIPDLISPSEWLPVAFGEEMLEFESETEAGEMMGRLFETYNRLNMESREGKLRFPFDVGSLKNGDIERMGCWAYGLRSALSLRPGIFGLDDGFRREVGDSEDLEELSSALGVIMGVAGPEHIPEIFERMDFDPEADEEDAKLYAALFAMLPGAVATVQEYLGSKTIENPGTMPASGKPYGRGQEKTGRNAPCPCGSGRKFKKCCGA